MAGGGFQRGLPTRANSVEGGNFVPVDVAGPGKTRPILRDNLIEGLYAWRPDGVEGLYCGFDTDGSPSILVYDNNTGALTNVTPGTDANGNVLPPAPGSTTTIEFLALKYAPFYATGLGGYLAYILVRSSGGVVGPSPSTQIWIYNAGTADPTGGSLPVGTVTTSYFGILGVGPVEGIAGFGPFRDIGFEWAGTSSVVPIPVDQIPFGILVGDGDQAAPPLAANMYNIGFQNPTPIITPLRLVPDAILRPIINNLPAGTGTNKITKLTMFRKSFACLTFDTGLY